MRNHEAKKIMKEKMKLGDKVSAREPRPGRPSGGRLIVRFCSIIAIPKRPVRQPASRHQRINRGSDGNRYFRFGGNSKRGVSRLYANPNPLLEGRSLTSQEDTAWDE